MKKKVLMGLVLLAIIGTSSVFAQKVGDSVQLSGKTYRVESVSNGRVVLQLAAILNLELVLNKILPRTTRTPRTLTPIFAGKPS